MEKLTDKFLWKALKEGDINAFSVLFESYYPDLHSYGLKISKNTALTEDTLQDFFLYVFEQIRYALILGASWKSIEKTLKGSKINLSTKKIMEVMKRKPSLTNPIPSWRRSNNSKDDVIDLDLDLDLDIDIDLLKDVDL